MILILARRAALALATLAPLWLGASAAAETACPPTTVFTTAFDHLEGYRVFVGADGDSEVEPYRIDAKVIPLLKTGKPLGLIELLKAPNRFVQIVVGPADVDLPLHPTPYKELFVMLGGSATLITKKVSVEVGPGSVLLMDDAGATNGHGAHFGPCGYVSVSIAP